jgi:hypothetical protein
MTYSYKLQKDPITNATDMIKRSASGTLDLYIPLDPNNRNYQEYLKWVAAGNTPEAAD